MELEDNIIPLNKELEDDILGDIQNLEAELLNKYSSNPETEDKQVKNEVKKEVIQPQPPIVKEKPLEPSHGRKPKKNDLIMRIMQTQEIVTNYETRPKSHYLQMRVSQLQEILAELTRLAQAEYLGEDTKGEDGNHDPEKVAKKLKNNLDGGELLFNFNLILVNLMEAGSYQFEDKIKTNLYGLTDDTIKHKEALKSALEDIYQENPWIADYLSGASRYMAIMGGLTAGRMIHNKKNFQPQLAKQSEQEED